MFRRCEHSEDDVQCSFLYCRAHIYSVRLSNINKIILNWVVIGSDGDSGIGRVCSIRRVLILK